MARMERAGRSVFQHLARKGEYTAFLSPVPELPSSLVFIVPVRWQGVLEAAACMSAGAG